MIYLDYAATTPCKYEGDPSLWGNSASSYSLGIRSAQIEEEARNKLAKALHCTNDQLIFTSGGTEANNLAIFGALLYYQKFIDRNHPFLIAMSPIAHHSMIETERLVDALGGKITWLQVDKFGRINLDYAERLIQKANMVAIDWVNNELGTVQYVDVIGEMTKKNHALFMVDAVQAFPHIPINLQQMSKIDFLSISAHKIYGPKGVGALFVRDKERTLSPIIVGGSQEEKFRGGTKNSMLIQGFGEAVDNLTPCVFSATRYFDFQEQRLKYFDLQEQLCLRLQEQGVDYNRNSPVSDYAPAILNLDVKVDSATLVSLLSEEEIYVSTGAACGGSFANSHVIKQIGGNPSSALRISFGQETTVEEVLMFADCLAEKIKELKGMTI